MDQDDRDFALLIRAADVEPTRLAPQAIIERWRFGSPIEVVAISGESPATLNEARIIAATAAWK